MAGRAEKGNRKTNPKRRKQKPPAPSRRGRRRSPEQRERDRKQIARLAFVQCWKAPEIAGKLGISVKMVDRDLKALRDQFRPLFDKHRDEYLRGILAGIQERCEERVRKLWNEYVDLTNKIKEIEKKEHPTKAEILLALQMRRMRVIVLRHIRFEDSGLVDRLKKLGIVKGDDEDGGFDDEKTIWAKIQVTYQQSKNDPGGDNSGGGDGGDNR
jgi:hypothetical protein